MFGIPHGRQKIPLLAVEEFLFCFQWFVSSWSEEEEVKSAAFLFSPVFVDKVRFTTRRAVIYEAVNYDIAERFN